MQRQEVALGTGSRMMRGLSRVVLAGCVLAIAGAHAVHGQEAESLSASFRKAARKVVPAVVTVRPLGGTAMRLPGLPMPNVEIPPFSRGPMVEPPPGEAGGSGVVIDAAKGLVLTNDHVVNGAARVVVILHDGRERFATQVRRDPKSDLALLVIDSRGLVQAELGDSNALDVGDWILAVGQPFGLSGTVTAGIVSGKGRGVGVSMYEDLIQTDAAINPGNSGGPMVNLRGEVVGINTALKTTRGRFEGVGFAVPIARAKRVAADLAEFGAVRRAYLGMSIGPVDAATAERLEQSGAVVVNEVRPGSPADRAGLKPGDVVVALEGAPVQGVVALQSAVEFAAAGEPIRLTVEHDGKRREATVRPEPQPETFGLPPNPNAPRVEPEPPKRAVAEPVHFTALGLRLAELDPTLARRFKIDESRSGLVIVGVDAGGPADRGGLEIGMVVTDAANRRVESLADFRAALADRPEDRDLLVRVLRGSKAEFRVVADRSGAPQDDEPPPKESDKPRR